MWICALHLCQSLKPYCVQWQSLKPSKYLKACCILDSLVFFTLSQATNTLGIKKGIFFLCRRINRPVSFGARAKLHNTLRYPRIDCGNHIINFVVYIALKKLPTESGSTTHKLGMKKVNYGNAIHIQLEFLECGDGAKMEKLPLSPPSTSLSTVLLVFRTLSMVAELLLAWNCSSRQLV